MDPSIYFLNSVLIILTKDFRQNTHNQRAFFIGYTKEHHSQKYQAKINLLYVVYDAKVYRH
jgi:hypothetical protein